MFCAHWQFAFEQFGLVASVAAVIQLVRRPETLKAKLRSARIASGPLYMFSAIGAFRDKLEVSIVGSLATVGIVMVLLAAVFLRPDNHALDFVLGGLRRKAMCHGILMVTSLTVLTFLLLTEGCWFAFLNLASLFLEFSRRCKCLGSN